MYVHANTHSGQKRLHVLIGVCYRGQIHQISVQHLLVTVRPKERKVQLLLEQYKLLMKTKQMFLHPIYILHPVKVQDKNRNYCWQSLIKCTFLYCRHVLNDGKIRLHKNMHWVPNIITRDSQSNSACLPNDRPPFHQYLPLGRITTSYHQTTHHFKLNKNK